MELDKNIKGKIDNYFENTTPEELFEKSLKYGMMEERNLVPELKSEKRVLDAYFKVDEQIFTIKKEDGTEKDISRLRLNRPDAVAVLIFNEDKGTFTFVRQYRPAIGLKNDNTPIIEIAAGLIDEGETPYEAAKREVLEETGYEVENLEFLHRYYPGVGYCSERTTIFLATITEENKVSEGGGLEIEGEMLEIVEQSLEDTFKGFENKEFIDGKTIISLQEFKNRYIEVLVGDQDQIIASQTQRIKDLEMKLSLLKGTPKG